MTREAALNDLLASLFSAEELRRHLALEREGIEKYLPDRGTPAELVFAAVDVLKRRGFIDRTFFDNLQAAYPQREGDIRKVRSRWLHTSKLDRGELWANNRYELIYPCGKGGFGLVWKAIDHQVGEFVALKILLEHHADDRRIRQRFCRGAAALAKLSHPGIVRVRSGVEQEGLRFFYAMDYVDGLPLNALLATHPLASLLDYILQIGAAVEYLHRNRLLHRDIKPSNILITSQQRAKLIDFDLVAGENFVPMTTRALGTAIYAPPEALMNVSKSTAYDVFSLARTFECAIRGRELKFNETDCANSIDSLNAAEAVKTILRAAMQKEHGQRTRSVEQFCRNLRRAFTEAKMLDIDKAIVISDYGAEGTVGSKSQGIIAHMQGKVASLLPEEKVEQGKSSGDLQVFVQEVDNPAEDHASLNAGAIAQLGSTKDAPETENSTPALRQRFPRRVMAWLTGLVLLAAVVLIKLIYTGKQPEVVSLSEFAPPQRDDLKSDNNLGTPNKESVPVLVAKGAGVNLQEWWCLCYRKKPASRSEPITNCRKSKDECEVLQRLAESGDDDIVAGSLTHSCREIQRAEHPGDALGGREKWSPSKKPGAWLANRTCLLSSAGGFLLDKESFLRKESLGGIALGQSESDLIRAHGKPTVRGAVEDVPATGERQQAWVYNDNHMTVTMDVKESLFNSNKTVAGVQIESGSPLTTAKGIGIGSTKNEVFSLYGSAVDPEGGAVNSSRFVAGSIYQGLFFSFDSSGKVDSIFLGAGAE